jgi:hypothetical protein
VVAHTHSSVPVAASECLNRQEQSYASDIEAKTPVSWHQYHPMGQRPFRALILDGRLSELVGVSPSPELVAAILNRDPLA